jgi:sterol 3beta-glucosyltransferase
MRFYLVTFGSRGDNEPFRALATAASKAGHEVIFAHTSDLADDPDAEYADWRLPGSLEEMIVEQGVSVWRALREYRSTWKPALEAVYAAAQHHIVSCKPDVVVYHPKVLNAPVVARSVGALAVCAEIVPTLTPTREFPVAGIPASIPRFLYRASFSLVQWGLAAFGNKAKELARELEVMTPLPHVTLCPVSPCLVPQPSDWPKNAHITGAWHLDDAPAQLSDPELDEFLEAGSVVYTGFGSMKSGDGRRRAQVIVEASRKLGMRTLLVTGWGGLDPADEVAGSKDVLVRRSVRHARVLPKVSLAVHHGGAGTTHAMLRSGVPSVIMPFLADQPWWAQRLHDRGLGPRALSKNCRQPSQLSQAMSDAMDCQQAVNEVATSMAKEDGCLTAIELITHARREPTN